MKYIKLIKSNNNIETSYDALLYAKNLNFKDIPNKIINIISKDPYISLEYAKNLNFKNIPDKIINGISKDPHYSLVYAYNLNYNNVPEIILNSIKNNNRIFKQYLKYTKNK